MVSNSIDQGTVEPLYSDHWGVEPLYSDHWGVEPLYSDHWGTVEPLCSDHWGTVEPLFILNNLGPERAVVLTEVSLLQWMNIYIYIYIIY